MTDLTREQIQALRDGATPGPYEISGGIIYRLNEDGVNRITIQIDAGYVRSAKGREERISRPEYIATMDMICAAPVLARQLLATLDALAEAQAAQAGVVERAANRLTDLTFWTGDDDHWTTLVALDEARAAIRSLADPTGVKLLAELRAHRDRLLSDYAAQVQDMIAQQLEITSLRAERDRLAAANAALEAKVAGLVGIADDIDAQVKTTREAAADSGMDRHQVELVAICTSHFLDNARHLRALAAWNRRTPEPGKDGNNG